MRIGIDARELCGHATGVGRYLGGLLREWGVAEYARRHEFVLYTHEALTLPLDARRFPSRLVGGDGGTRWEQLRLPAAAAKDHLDVFFAPAYTAPWLRRVPVVVAIHDVSFAAHPEWFSTREGIRRRWLTRRSSARAALVITISEFSRRELIERLGVPDARIRVIPPGVTPVAHIEPAAPAAGGPDRRDRHPRVLFVGSIFRRRHVADLVRAFAALARARSDMQLDLVGDNRTYPYEDIQHAIDLEALNGRARWHRYVPDEELGRLYGAARAFAFLSEYEGLGLTPLEALASGVPPVLLDTPVARESCGEAAIYARSAAPSDVGPALAEALFDETSRTRIAAAAPGVLRRYDWPRAARETLAAIETA